MGTHEIASPLTYRELLETLDRWFARGREAAGKGVIPCRLGCGACCHGVFDISPADAALLAEGLAALPEADREAVRARANDQLERFAKLLPDWGRRGMSTVWRNRLSMPFAKSWPTRHARLSTPNPVAGSTPTGPQLVA